MARIYGILRNATGIRPNTKIILTAKRTSTQVVIFAPDRLVTTDANGRYDIECNVCGYLVTIMQPGLPIEHVGNINVYADSADGTLESFLTDIREDDLTPDVIKRVEEAAKLAELSASKAEQAAESAADDAINNVMPTLDNKIKLANDEVIKASKEVTKAKDEVTKATTQANIAKDAAQEALHNASLTFISGGTFTPKSSAEYPNVSGVVRDTIWLISFPNRDDKYVYTAGVLKGITVKSGDQLFYDTPQDEFKWLPSGAGGAVYSVNGKTGTSVTLTSGDVNAYSKSQTDAESAKLKTRIAELEAEISPKPNLFINANESINQRGVANWDGVVVGEYGFDRLKKISPSVKRQPIEEGGFLNGVTYTISWIVDGNHTAKQIISPSSGNWDNSDLDMPISAKNFKLEAGSVATPFAPDDPATNLAKCQRYYYKLDPTANNCYVHPHGGFDDNGRSLAPKQREVVVWYPVTMRIAVEPDMQLTEWASTRSKDWTVNGTSTVYDVSSAGNWGGLQSLEVNAEL